MNQELDFHQILTSATKAVDAGQEILLKYFGKLNHIEKKVKAGLVSEADKESEKVISEMLAKDFPEIEFLGEETFASGEKTTWTPEHVKPRWILDPLDGTTNYIHQLPIFCISLGLEYRGQIHVAIIDMPLLKERFTAIRGQGAWLETPNGKIKLRVSSTKDFADAFLATGFVSEHEEVIAEQLPIFSKIVRECRGVRRLGAAAYDLALVAKGSYDGYWERNIQPWDAAAGILLVEEAGGKITTYHGDPYHPYKTSIVASNSEIHEDLQTRIASLALSK